MGETDIVGKHKQIFYLEVSAVDTTLITISMYHQIILAGLNQILLLVNDATLRAWHWYNSVH